MDVVVCRRSWRLRAWQDLGLRAVRNACCHVGSKSQRGRSHHRVSEELKIYLASYYNRGVKKGGGTLRRAVINFLAFEIYVISVNYRC